MRQADKQVGKLKGKPTDRADVPARTTEKPSRNPTHTRDRNAEPTKRGFSLMEPGKQRSIASKGGKAAHLKGTAREWTADEARRAGKKGGQVVSRDRVHMEEIGRVGALEAHRLRLIRKSLSNNRVTQEHPLPSRASTRRSQASEVGADSESRVSMPRADTTTTTTTKRPNSSANTASLEPLDRGRNAEDEVPRRAYRDRDWEKESIRILILDPQPITQEGLASLLLNERWVSSVDVVGSLPDLVRSGALKKHSYDVAVLDIELETGDIWTGIAAITEVREQQPEAGIIVLTRSVSDEGVFRALRAGASSFLPKSIQVTNLKLTIQAVASGRKEIPAYVAAMLADHVATETLSPREEDVLRRVGQGNANSDIAKQLFVSAATVRGHLHNTYRKLGAHDRAEAILIGLRRGLLPVPRGYIDGSNSQSELRTFSPNSIEAKRS